MVLFALETIYLLCTKQMVYMCKAKACTASGAHSNDEDASVLPVAPGDVQQGVQYPARATKIFMQIFMFGMVNSEQLTPT